MELSFFGLIRFQWYSFDLWGIPKTEKAGTEVAAAFLGINTSVLFKASNHIQIVAAGEVIKRNSSKSR